jgi:hypothetical protein
MNAPTLSLPSWSLPLNLQRLRGLLQGASFLIVVNLVINGGWLLNYLLWKVPRLGLLEAFRSAAPQQLVLLWLTVPPQFAVAAILNLAPATGWRRWVTFMVAFVFGFTWCLYWDPDGLFQAGLPADRTQLLRYLGEEFESGITAVLFMWAFIFYRSAARARDDAARAQIAASTIDAELQRARLGLLRAQIEPHFLFNTLANVRSLARLDLAAGLQLLDHLMQYFTAALPRLRREDTSLGDEMQLIDAYLAIYRVRMGQRLSYEVSLPPELAGVRIPTMVLLTLVENALKHGITPAVEGGSIRVSAAYANATLELKVADSGVGLRADQGQGSGLSNTRTRLRLRYGESATLSLSPAQPRGVVAMVRIPVPRPP